MDVERTIEIRRYDPSMRPQWDDLVENSRNATFLHLRDYMDYHSRRFEDCSLMAFRHGRLLAALPANRERNVLCSHRGLTYGGWLMPAKKTDASAMLDITAASIAWMRDMGIEELVYKPVPHIYHSYPAEEDVYALWRMGAQMEECSISTTIDLAGPLPLDRGCKSAVNMAARAGVQVSESGDIERFWRVLEYVLRTRYAVKPVHTADEMRLLRSRFPDNIKLYTATLDNEVVAGVLMYYTRTVAHSQYIAATDRGRETKALTLLFDNLIRHSAQNGYRYFDFGISTENHGQYLNRGLAQQKARLGGRGTVTQIFKLDIHAAKRT